MAAPGGFNYKPNVNRAITKKWKDASQANYDGDDWGDDDYGYEEPAPVSAGNARHPAWGGQGQMYPSNRSVTNPSPPRAGGRASFDRGDERRNFSTGAGFESPYPTTQRNPFPEPEHDYQNPPPQSYRPQPPLQLHTQGQGPYPPSGFRPGSRGPQYPAYADAPFSAPGGYPHQRSHSGNRSAQGDSQQRQQSPVRPDSRASNTSGRYFPPRKSSLSQQQPPPEIASIVAEAAPASEPTSAPAAEVKALPFIRPADIYKRIEEEREKERRSQESSRPSFDSATSRIKDPSADARSVASDSKDQAPPGEKTEEAESARRLKPTLDTVVERKSEYGFDNMLKSADPSHPALMAGSNRSDGVHRQVTDASSIYTDRPDPVSASTISRNESLRKDFTAPVEFTSAQPDQFNLPQIDRMSSFGTDLGSITPSQTHDQPSLPSGARMRPEPNQIVATNPSDDRLGHTPSLGYRSVVQQAFDESQEQNPRSATSGTETLPRSNSASTSDISPIMSRHRDIGQESSVLPVSHQTIPEEPSDITARPVSSSTLKAGDLSKAEPSLPAPSVIQQGYRRDQTPPSRDNSPAKRPLSIQTGVGPKPETAALDNSEPGPTSGSLAQSAATDNNRGRSAATPASAAAADIPSFPTHSSQTTMEQPPNPRSTSEEYQEWQAQRKQFNAQFGIQDSNPTTPGIPSPISRTETPAKGSVRNMAENLESRSGRGSPAHATDVSQNLDPSRPSAQTRMESFRPQIPGGWQSYTATPAAVTPSQELPHDASAPQLPSQLRFDSTDSIPTAKAPKDWHAGHEGAQHQAFAAAAAAGTVLAGSFNGPALSHRANEASDDSSENEWDQSSTSSKQIPATSESHDFAALSQQQSQIPPLAGARDSLPPTPLPKDTPLEAHSSTTVPAPLAKDTPISNADSQSTVDYFPAPLRTSRVIDPKQTIRPPIPNVTISSESAADNDPDRLQDEIVKSLAPKSLNVNSQPEETTQKPPFSSSPVIATITSAALPKMDNSSSKDEAKTTQDGTTVSADYQSKDISEPSKHGHIPQASVDTAVPSTPPRPFLEQRFSWETGHDQNAGPMTPPKVTSPVTDSPDTGRGPPSVVRDIGPSSPPPMASPSTPTAANRAPASSINQIRPTSSKATGSPFSANPVFGLGHAEKTPFRGIMNMENQQDRIKAFNDNQTAYATSDGMFEQWLLSMRTPDHSEIFASQGRVLQARDDVSGPGMLRPSLSRPQTNPGGSKQMQEDGKRLMAAAGRFGGKAGFAAKGLFAKGKDKLRSASASDKGFLANRRKSTGASTLDEEEPQQQNRNSTFLSAPPQIPPQNLSSSPVDAGGWGLPFSSSGDPDKPMNSSRDLLNDSANSERESEHTQKGPNSLAVPAITSNTSPSALISAIGSLHREETGVPSRSISEVTQDTEYKPSVGIGQSDHSVTGIDTAPQLKTSQSNSNAEIPASERELGIVAGSRLPEQAKPHEENPVSKEAGLAVPDAGRRSIISNVSSPSPSPATDQEDHARRRSVSPADEAVPDTETVPSYDAGVLTKEQEASADRAVAADQGLNDPLPSYEDNSVPVDAGRKRRIGSDAQIVPIADLSESRQSEAATASSRPFSFMGMENLVGVGPNQNTDDQIHKVPSQPMSPVSQTISQPISQVSAEDGGYNSPVDRQRRSYSRPFGADSNIQGHLAYRQNDEPIDRSRMYSTDSPLPSARRPQEDFGRFRQQSPPISKVEEEGYRIPGPYVQEYRSPRQNPSPLPTSYSQKDEEAAFRPRQSPQTAMMQPHYQGVSPTASPQQQPIGPSASVDVQKPKQRTFGGLFQGRSKSSVKQIENEALYEEPGMSKQKRGSMLRRNSRQDSIASQQSSAHENRDQVGHLPSADTASKRRMSRDFLRSSTPTSVERPEGKKKRFSGMGALFSRGSKVDRSTQPQRSSTLPTNSSQSNRPVLHEEPSSYQQASMQSAQPVLDHSTGGFRGTPPPTGGYYAPGGTQQPYQRAISPRGPQSYDTGFGQQGQFAQRPGQAFERRPSDLRIDTSGSGRNIQSMPATAPPHTHAGRDISYNARPYVPPSSRGPSAGPVAARAESPAAHVIDLHKRSRSPKLGRRSSSEERKPSMQEQGLGAPVGALGTFSSKKISPVGGVPRPDEDQEAPFRIGIPGEPSEEERRRRAKQALIEQSDRNSNAGPSGSGLGPGRTVAERIIGPQVPISLGPGSTTRAPLKNMNSNSGTNRDRSYVAELPGSKAEGYESEEEIPMSATAYPGQWQDMPVFVGDGRWDD